MRRQTTTISQSPLIDGDVRITRQARENINVLYLVIKERFETVNIDCPSFEKISNMFVRNLVIEEIINCLDEGV